ncbi:hypothetical protein J5X98_09805 [Leptothermofonsia sichuanensis E412]|uniref:hypothetical protein n=1 Tax=Leptothermofonsia sichuanensis TaxID=2917832 RepID=UPI001CA6B528|nr:hypothetical protein [Leptothermofonsia sichuanensis]QZZ22621.1 hypothetical protein J5X98_09805 [Leptothermofonsia sichuanensis E412]
MLAERLSRTIVRNKAEGKRQEAVDKIRFLNSQLKTPNFQHAIPDAQRLTLNFF